MKIVVLLWAVSLLQLCHTAPAVDDELHTVLRALDKKELEKLVELLLETESSDVEPQNQQLDFESRKRELMADSLQLTEAVEQAQRETAENNQVSGAARLLQAYLRSSNYVHRVSQIAKQQLNAISLFKKDWDAAYGENGNNEEFWRVVKKTNFFSPSTCSTDDDAEACLETRTIDSCPLPDPSCMRARNGQSEYRTYDGSCNNRETHRAGWGMANTAQVRIVEPEYEDNMKEPRKSTKNSGTLPGAREVSSLLNNLFLHIPARTFSEMHMQYGQFLDHDLSKTDAATTLNERNRAVALDCPCDSTDEECWVIEVPVGDPMREGQECMKFTRSAAWPQSGCTNDKRQQVNSITSWIDCSQVYGSYRTLATRLRDSDTTRGKLDTTEHPTNSAWKRLLPLLDADEQGDECADGVDTCFLAGDVRRNAQPGLMAMHTIWVRMHNYIEEKLHNLNPGWDGDILFQESRRLLIAITQHITYNEYLGEVVGPNIMSEAHAQFNNVALEVDADSTDYVQVYDNTVQPNIANSFSTAAFRFGHSQVNSYLKFAMTVNYTDDFDCNTRVKQVLGNPELIPDYCVRLTHAFNNPTTIYDSPAGSTVSGVDSVLKGMMRDPGERIDQWYTPEMFNYLFTANASDPSVFGFDLLALNIQRARDHGIPGYMKFREHYGQSTTDNWANRPEDMEEPQWGKLEAIYDSPEDIDLYAGGIIVSHNAGAKIGDLFKVMIAEQFMKLKVADRFWYENGYENCHNANDAPITCFTIDQLIEIRKMTLSKMFCVTMDDPGMLPTLAMHSFDPEDPTGNPLISCDEQAEIDFSHWMDPDAQTA